MLRFAVIFCAIAVALASPSNRIVNGVDAKEGQYPYIVSLRGPAGSHNCGASIISKDWILTAAHCIHGRENNPFTVQYGVTKISATGPTVARVKKIVKHEKYEPANSHANDIALLQLEKPLTFNKFVQPVNLPKANVQTKHGLAATLVGWGLNSSFNGVIQEHLQELHYNIVGQKECAQMHQSRVFESNICAAAPGYDKAQCSGDSGGPLTVGGVQVGVVSWSRKPCGVARLPGVFAQVSFYRQWIKDITGV